jgi:hypothetical protein
MPWKLRFPGGEIRYWADRYDDADDTDVLEAGRRARRAGCFSREDFLLVCKWKTSRSRSRCRRNSAEEVEEVTRVALSTPVERLRMAALRCLDGVDWPTASVLLHIAHRDPYPILDVRALWSLGFDAAPSHYTQAFWEDYVRVCRELSVEHNVDLRTLDRALWQYSKEQSEARGHSSSAGA